ncbi:hypothetical protein ABPG75_006370 [Micractinium tetrahymenae]
MLAQGHAVRSSLPAALRRWLSSGAAGELQGACLENRGVIRLAGPGLVQFLQGLVTNDVSGLEAPGAPAQYAAILNAQGRYLHDLFLHRTAAAEPTVLADVDAAGKEDLLRLLRRYRLRQKLDIEDVSATHQVWARFAGTPDALRAPPPPGWAPDPRLWQLGLRAVLPVGDSSSSSGSGSSSDWREHRRWRMLFGVAEGDSEIPTGEVIPLEFNLDGLNGISFKKGCYVGQELMARTHFKGVVRKRLMPFVAVPPGAGSSLMHQLEAAGPAAPRAAVAASEPAGSDSPAAAAVVPGAPVFAEQPGGGKRKQVGVVRVTDGTLGLAVLRLGAVEAARATGQPLLLGEGEAAAELCPWRPDWWPGSWGKEEAGGSGGDGE